MIQLLWKRVWRFRKKLGIKPPYDSEILLLGIYPEETRTVKDTCTPMFIAARLECLRETGLILRCDRKVGNPFQTKQRSPDDSP